MVSPYLKTRDRNFIGTKTSTSQLLICHVIANICVNVNVVDEMINAICQVHNFFLLMLLLVTNVLIDACTFFSPSMWCFGLSPCIARS